jgi:hypothetical protein
MAVLTDNIPTTKKISEASPAPNAKTWKIILIHNTQRQTFDTAGTEFRASTISGALVWPLVKPYTSW